MNHASSHIEAPCTTQAVDMWTMRLNGAGLARGQREYTLPTAPTLAHLPTASHLNLIKEADQHPVNLHCQSPQLSAPFDRSPKASPRIKPELERTHASRAFWRRPMNSASRDFVNVDMRGMKAALAARAQADRVSVSRVVRAAVARYLGIEEGSEFTAFTDANGASSREGRVRLSIRLAEAEAHRLAADASASGLSQTAYLVRLIDGAPAGSTGANYREQVAALTASTTELAALGQSLCVLARQWRQSRDAESPCRHDMLLGLLPAGDPRTHDGSMHCARHGLRRDLPTRRWLHGPQKRVHDAGLQAVRGSLQGMR